MEKYHVEVTDTSGRTGTMGILSAITRKARAFVRLSNISIRKDLQR